MTETKQGEARPALSYDRGAHHFVAAAGVSIETIAREMHAPLSVILQVTRRCNLTCLFCSETVPMQDPSLDDLAVIATNLAGVKRVFLSGGEPLLRQDLLDVVDLFAARFLVGLPTNATPAKRIAEKLAGKVTCVNVGLEGPRTITNRVRGDYDRIMAGVRAFVEAGLPMSLSAVVLRSVIEGLPLLNQIADDFGAGKLKLIMPIRKGNGMFLPEDEFLTNEEATRVFHTLREEKTRWGWRHELRMTVWTPETEGYSILVYPDGTAWAWPVFDAPDKVELVGNLLRESVTDLWTRYRFKQNHLRKYLGQSILTA